MRPHFLESSPRTWRSNLASEFDVGAPTLCLFLISVQGSRKGSSYVDATYCQERSFMCLEQIVQKWATALLLFCIQNMTQLIGLTDFLEAKTK